MNLERTEREDLYRDKESNALLNTNNRALQAYKMKKKQMEEQNNLSNRVDAIEDKIDHIYLMMKHLISEIQE